MKYLLIAFLGLGWAGLCHGQAPVNADQIVLVKKTGSVCFWSTAGRWEELLVKSQLPVGVYLQTGANSEAILTFGKKAVVTLGENTVIGLAESVFEQDKIKSVRIAVGKGKVWSALEKLSSPEAKFQIDTPNALAGVRGTVFTVGVEPGTDPGAQPQDATTRVSVVTGEVGVGSKLAQGYVVLKENMSTVIVANKPPIPPEVLEEKEKQEWEQWKKSIPFSEIGPIAGLAETNAILNEEAARIVRETGQARKGTVKVEKDFDSMESAIQLYYADTRVVPNKLKDLLENPGVPGWKGPYLGAGTNFMDPYGHPYFYRPDRQTPGRKKYVELSTKGLIGAAGDTYGEESRNIYIDKLDQELEKKLKAAQ